MNPETGVLVITLVLIAMGVFLMLFTEPSDRKETAK